MKKVLKVIIIIAIILFAIYAGYKSWMNLQKENFIRMSILYLSDNSFAKLEKSTNVFVIKLSDGSKFAFMMNHSCCSGDWYDCVIMKDNNSKILVDRQKNFCGIEGLSCELNQLNKKNAVIFRQELERLGLKFKSSPVKSHKAGSRDLE